MKLEPDADIMAAYEEYEKERMLAEIEEFATENDLEPEFVSGIVHQYFIDPLAVTKESLRQDLTGAGVKGLLKITSAIGKILTFLRDSKNKFTVEGE